MEEVRELFYALDAIDKVGDLGGLASGALDLLVALMAHEQDVVAVAGEALHLAVHLGHQRARGVQGELLALACLVAHRGGNAVGGENQPGALGGVGRLVDEDDATARQGFDHVAVVHDLFADVNRGAVLFQRLFHGFYRSIHSRAVAAGSSEEYLLRSFRHAP